MVRATITIFLGMLLIACNGGSSDEGNSNSPSEPNNPNPSSDAVLSSGFSGDLLFEDFDPSDGLGDGADGSGGIAIGSNIGTVRNADLIVYRLTDGVEIGRTSTGATGLATLRLPDDHQGGIFAELIGTVNSDYFDLAVSEYKPYPEGYTLRAFIPEVIGNIGIGLKTEAIVTSMLNQLALLNLRSTQDVAKPTPTTGKTAELINLTASPDALEIYEETERRASRLLNSLNIHRHYASYSNNTTFEDLINIGLLSDGPAEFEGGNIEQQSREQIRNNPEHLLGELGILYSEFSPESTSPVRELVDAVSGDFGDNLQMDLSFFADDKGLQQIISKKMNYRIRNTTDYLNVRYASTDDEADYYTLSTYELNYQNNQGEYTTYLTWITNDGKLYTAEQLADGSFGEEYLLASQSNLGRPGYPGFDMAVSLQESPFTLSYYGANTNGYLGDIEPDTEYRDVDGYDVTFPEQVTDSFRQGNTALVLTENFDNANSFYAFGRAGPGSIYGNLYQTDTPSTELTTITIADAFGRSTAAPVGLWVDPFTDSAALMDRSGVLLRPGGQLVDLSDHFTGIDTNFSIKAITDDLLVVHNQEAIVLVGETGNAVAQACAPDGIASDQPFVLVDTSNSPFDSLFISDVLVTRGNVYWVTVDLAGVPSYYLSFCGLSDEPTTRDDEPPKQSGILLTSAIPIKLNPGPLATPDVIFASVSPGPMPVGGSTVTLYLNGSEFGGYDPTNGGFNTVTTQINTNQFELKGVTRKLKTIGTGNQEREVEYVKYTFIDRLNRRALVVSTRSDLDPEGGEAVFSVRLVLKNGFGPTTNISTDLWLATTAKIEPINANNSYDQTKLDGVDISGTSLDFSDFQIEHPRFENSNYVLNGTSNLK